MKLNDLHEMTMRVPSYEKMGQSLPHFQTLKDIGTHCGDIEHYNVYKHPRDNLTDYAVFDGDDCIAFFVLINPNTLEIGYIIPEKRSIGLSPMFLFFLKRNEGLAEIRMSDKQSEQSIKSLIRTSKLFKTYWVKGDQKVPFDPDTIDQFYSSNGATGWTVVLENNSDFSTWPKFYKDDGLPDLTKYYTCYILEESE